jgi:hypothetical protein
LLTESNETSILSRIQVALVVLGDGLIAVGYDIVFLALRENSWAASIIEVRPGQSVISTGPYSIVRHPSFAASIFQSGPKTARHHRAFDLQWAHGSEPGSLLPSSAGA